MIRHSSIALTLLSLAFAPSCAFSDERAPYLDSVLFTGDRDETRTFGDVSASLDQLVPDPMPVDTSSVEAAPTTASSTATTPPLHVANSSLDAQPGSFGGTMIGALLGGAAGGYGGAVAAFELTGPHSGEWDGVGEALIGLSFGYGFGSATGAHLANGGRGSFGTTLVVSTLAALVIPVAIWGGPPVWVIAGLGQAALVAAVERGTAERKRARAAEQSGSPANR